jgi:hypothetical protein
VAAQEILDRRGNSPAQEHAGFRARSGTMLELEQAVRDWMAWT